MNFQNSPALESQIKSPVFSGLTQVSRDEFFTVMNPRDVNPSPQGRWDNVLGYRSDWKSRGGARIGACIGGTVHQPTAYFLSSGYCSAAGGAA